MEPLLSGRIMYLCHMTALRRGTLKQGGRERMWQGPINSHSSFIITITAEACAAAGAVGNTCHAACPDLAWKVKSYGKFADFYGEVSQCQVVAIQSHLSEDTCPIQRAVFLHSSISQVACLFPRHASGSLEMLTDLKSYIMKFVRGPFSISSVSTGE